MPKIDRKNAKIFGSTAGPTQIGQFGSLAAGSVAYSTDPETIQALSNYLGGWFEAVVGANSPAIEDMNALCYLFAYQIAYGFQSGVPEWDDATTYYIGDIARSGNSLYQSLTDDNLNNAVTSETNWRLIDAPTASYDIEGLGLQLSVAANALTIAAKQPDGTTNLSAGRPAKVAFRSSTSSSGAYNQRLVTGALSLVVSSGSTLGQASGVNQYGYIYALDNAGTVELAVSSTRYDDGSIVSTTAEGGAGAADNAYTIYSTTARSNVPIRLIGRFLSNQAAAGTWATAIAEVALSFQQETYPQSIIYTDQKTANTVGGSGLAGAGAYATRTLNTVNNPKNYPWAALSSNQITLQPGTYLFSGSAPFLRVGDVKTRIRNITDGSDDVVGTSEYTDPATNNQVRSSILGTVTYTTAKVIEFQYRIGNNVNTEDLGHPANLAEPEIYTILEIRKISN